MEEIIIPALIFIGAAILKYMLMKWENYDNS